MPKDTPTTEHGQLYDAVIASAKPRAEEFVKQILNHLKACDQEVLTHRTFFLNSSEHQIEVPYSINGIPISLSFDANMFVWNSDPTLRCKVSVDSGRIYIYKESKSQKFHLTRLLRRLLGELQVAQANLEKRQKVDQARENFEALRERLGASGNDGSEIHKGSARVRFVPRTTTKVVVLLTVSHDEAAELVERYGGKP